jgi:hypothetical protein
MVMSMVKAKEKEMKDEKEAERKVRILRSVLPCLETTLRSFQKRSSLTDMPTCL